MTNERISIELINELRKRHQLDSFLKDYSAIHDGQNRRQYANTLSGLLEMADGFDKKRTPYVVIGGLAVMAYTTQGNPNTVVEWRGTDDIDLLAKKQDAEQILRATGYKFGQRITGKKGTGHLYNYIKNLNGEQAIVGLRESVELKNKDITDRILTNSTVVGIYGVPIRVPSVKDLVALKTDANREKDRKDIAALKKFYNV